MFGAFFFVPDLGSVKYLQAGKQALSKLVYNSRKDRVVPIKPPAKGDSDDILEGISFLDHYHGVHMYTYSIIFCIIS